MSTAIGSLGAVHSIALSNSGRWAAVRELNGLDEQSVGGRSTQDAVRLLDRLLVDEQGTAARAGEAMSLTLPERDLLLGATWRIAWSSHIAGTLSCSQCEKPFDYDFNIDDLTSHVRVALDELPNENSTYVLDSRIRFRLPTAADELATVGLENDQAEQTLLRRCLVDGDAESDYATIEAAMEQVGSGLDLDFHAACPECATVDTLRFQIQDFLLGAITSDGQLLIHDVHRIARAYGWSLTEILSLPRSKRRAFVTILDGDTPGGSSW
jgi:hypothetical protein